MNIIAVTRGFLSLRTAALIVVRIRILKAIDHIFSLIVHGVADRKKSDAVLL